MNEKKVLTTFDDIENADLRTYNRLQVCRNVSNFPNVLAKYLKNFDEAEQRRINVMAFIESTMGNLALRQQIGVA